MRLDSKTIIENLNEGISLTATVKTPDGDVKIINDSDYPDKQSFKRDLIANEFKVLSIRDNRDNYVIDNSNYVSLNNVKKELKIWKRMQEESSNPNLYQDKVNELQDLINKAMKIEL